MKQEKRIWEKSREELFRELDCRETGLSQAGAERRNFATIVKAVKNGRNVYANIKKAIQFLLSGNTAGILTVLYASLLGLPVPFIDDRRRMIAVDQKLRASRRVDLSDTGFHKHDLPPVADARMKRDSV